MNEDDFIKSFGSAVQELVSNKKFLEAQVAIACAIMLAPNQEVERRRTAYRQIIWLQLQQEKELESQFRFLQMKVGLSSALASSLVEEIMQEQELHG